MYDIFRCSLIDKIVKNSSAPHAFMAVEIFLWQRTFYRFIAITLFERKRSNGNRWRFFNVEFFASSAKAIPPWFSRRTVARASTISFWLTPHRFAASFSHFLWQFTSQSVKGTWLDWLITFTRLTPIEKTRARV